MPKSAGRPSTSKASTLHDSRVSDDIRFDGRDHLVIATADGQRRCAGENCVSVVRIPSVRSVELDCVFGVSS